jgi:hypothetical protein
LNKYYPEFKPDANKVDHLLFDIGFTYGCLNRVDELLRRIAFELPRNHPLYPEIAGIRRAIEELHNGRIQMRNEIYDNAQGALEKGMNVEKN